LPAWLALGADLRGAFVDNDVQDPAGPTVAVFPMQADLSARVALPKGFSVSAIGGLRGQVRDPSLLVPIQNFQPVSTSELISREHYLMWRPSATGIYLRAGRFFAPYGLRFVEHTFYVRRYTGYDLYDETYTLSGGYVGDDWELHASAFTPPPTSFPNPLQSVGLRESGGALYLEKRFAGMASVALQGRVGTSVEAARYQGGAVGKLWLEPARVLFLGEADFIRQLINGAASYPENQFVSYLGATFFPVRGLMAGIAYERYQEDLSLATTARSGFDAEVNFFPWAHFELVLFGQYQIIGSGAASQGPKASLFMVQLHYYL
jgi:hypothetical protein